MDSASIEQMNKVRASLGMAPLPVPGKDSGGPEFQKGNGSDSEDTEDDISTLDKRYAAASGNWQKLEDERREKVERQKRKDAAKRARDTAQRDAKLEGKGLGDDDDDDDGGGKEVDTRTWLLQQKKRQKKIEKARQLEAELEERERQMQAEYTSKDLAGVKVGHEVDEFDDITGEQVLTLKDTVIGEESEDDELENQELKAKEKLEEKLRLQKKKPDYDPTEQGETKAVLSKYDEEIDGKKARRFTLDAQGTSTDAERRRVDQDGETKGSKGIKINLDVFAIDAPTSDYLDPSTAKIKKPKKKKDKKTRQKVADEDDIFPITQVPPVSNQSNVECMDIDRANGANSTSKKRGLEFDDDDLQSKLAEQRRQALKKRKKMDAAALARQMREEMPIDEQDPDEGGLLIDETTEFVANLKKPEEDEKTEQTRQKGSSEAPVQSNGANEEDEDGDTAMAGQSYASLADSNDRGNHETSTSMEATATGLDEEESMAGRGLGASLALLRKRGLIADHAPDDLSEKERKRSRFLSEKQHLIDDFDTRAREQREAERHSGRWEKMSHRDRDTYARQQNEAREQYLSRLQADMFNAQYRPDVKLQYHDEFGRSMNQKEAFKHLSHQFHGKTSGKQKTEKRLKKIEDEKRTMAKGMLNVGEEGGMLNVQGREGKRTKQAGVRLQ